MEVGLKDQSLSIEQQDTKVIVKAKIAFKKSSLKYFVKKFLKWKKLRRLVHVAAHPNIKTSYVLTHVTKQK